MSLRFVAPDTKRFLRVITWVILRIDYKRYKNMEKTYRSMENTLLGFPLRDSASSAFSAISTFLGDFAH
jgi:hypothetical protein